MLFGNPAVFAQSLEDETHDEDEDVQSPDRPTPPPPQLLEDPLLGLPACSVYLLYVCFAVLLFLMFLCMRTVQVLLPMPHVAVYASSF